MLPGGGGLSVSSSRLSHLAGLVSIPGLAAFIVPIPHPSRLDVRVDTLDNDIYTGFDTYLTLSRLEIKGHQGLGPHSLQLTYLEVQSFGRPLQLGLESVSVELVLGCAICL